jgi:SAM-dependent methyltransferase
MKIENRYLDGSYLNKNPNWDRKDSFWKSQLIIRLLTLNSYFPKNIVEVGCGSGDVLRYLQLSMPNVKLVGYDIAPDLKNFWTTDNNQLEFHLGDFYCTNSFKFDLMLMLDVFEHVRDPFTFLENSRNHASKFIFHIPLDLSSQSVFLNNSLIKARRNVGHLHFYNKDLAIETLTDCGFKILDFHYSSAISLPNNYTISSKFFRLFRTLFSFLGKDRVVRLLGGETLIVYAEPI